MKEYTISEVMPDEAVHEAMLKSLQDAEIALDLAVSMMYLTPDERAAAAKELERIRNLLRLRIHNKATTRTH